MLAAAALTPFAAAAAFLFATQAVLGVGRGLLRPALMPLAMRGVEPAARGTSLSTYQAMYGWG